MAFRRFARSRGRFSRFSSRFRRGRPSTRIVTPPRKWETALMFVDEQTDLVNTSAFTTQIYTHLASISLSLSAASAAGPEQRVGFVLASMERAIEIGGIVCDWDIDLRNVIDGQTLRLQDGQFWGGVQLLTDRLDVNTATTPTPASLGAYDPYRTTFPMATLTTVAPDTLQREVALPTRIHWSQTRLFSAGVMPILDEPEGALVNVWNQRVSLRPSTLNRRLRIRLDDDQALFWGWFFRVNASPDVDNLAIQVRRWLCGRIYYRYVQ